MSRKHHQHQSPRLDVPTTDPAEVAAAEKACKAIAAKCEEMVKEQTQLPEAGVVKGVEPWTFTEEEVAKMHDVGEDEVASGSVLYPRANPRWGDVVVVQRGAR